MSGQNFSSQALVAHYRGDVFVLESAIFHERAQRLFGRDGGQTVVAVLEVLNHDSQQLRECFFFRGEIFALIKHRERTNQPAVVGFRARRKWKGAAKQVRVEF